MVFKNFQKAIGAICGENLRKKAESPKEKKVNISELCSRKEEGEPYKVLTFLRERAENLRGLPEDAIAKELKDIRKILNKLYSKELETKEWSVQDILLCMSGIRFFSQPGIPKERTEAELCGIAKDFWENYKKKNGDENDKVDIIRGMGNEFSREIKENPLFFKTTYFEIVKCIAAQMEEASQRCSFLYWIEHPLKSSMKNKRNGGFGSITEQEEEEIWAYLDYLLQEGANAAANRFMDRIGLAKVAKRYDTQEKIKEKFLTVPEPQILVQGKKLLDMKSETKEYSYDIWYEEVKRNLEKDAEWEELDKWLTVYLSVHGVHNAIQEENWQDSEEYKTSFSRLCKCEMYDTDKYSYMTQICVWLAKIFMKVLSERSLEEAERFLDDLGDINIFCYEKYSKYTFGYFNYEEMKKLDFREVAKNVLACKDIECMLKIYFNTPLWLKEDIFNVVGNVKKRFKKDSSRDLGEYFNAYSFFGKIRSIDERTTVGRNRVIFVFQNVYSPNKNKKNEVKLSNDWSEEKTEEIIEWGEGETCCFKIDRMLEKNEILVKEVDVDYTEVDKEQFLHTLDFWYKKMKEEKRFVSWNGFEKIMGEEQRMLKLKTSRFSREERVAYATKFLEAIMLFLDMGKPDEVKNLLRNCSYPPLENVNEFRYIPNQRWTDMYFMDSEAAMIGALVKGVLDHHMLKENPHLKLAIYMNTCLKGIYPLEELLKDEAIRKEFVSEKTEWVIPVIFDMDAGEKIEKYFAADVNDKEKRYYIKTGYSFDGRFVDGNKYIEKVRELKKNGQKGAYAIYGVIKDICEEQKAFLLKDVYFDRDELNRFVFPWDAYRRNIYDLKKVKNIEGEGFDNLEYTGQRLKHLESDEIWNCVNRYHLTLERFTVEKQRAFITALNEFCHLIHFNIPECGCVLGRMTEADKNPFVILDYENKISKEELEKSKNVDINVSFSAFCEAAKELGVLESAVDVFVQSFLRWYIDEDTFVKAMAEIHDSNRSEADVRRCLDSVKKKRLKTESTLNKQTEKNATD